MKCVPEVELLVRFVCEEFVFTVQNAKEKVVQALLMASLYTI